MQTKTIYLTAGIIVIVIAGIVAVGNFKFAGKQLAIQTTSPIATVTAPLAILPSPIVEPYIEPEAVSYVAQVRYSLGELSVMDLRLVEGGGPDRALAPETGYTAKVVSNRGTILDIFKFDISLFLFDVEVPRELTETSFNLAAPYFPDGKSIDIYDPADQLKLSIDISPFSILDGGYSLACMLFDKNKIEGNLALDASGKNNRGILKDGSDVTLVDDVPNKIVQGKFGNALKFDGLDDIVEIPNRKELDFGGSTGITLSAWVYPELSMDHPTTIITKLPADGFTPLYTLGLDIHGRAAFALSTGQTDSLRYAVSNEPIPIDAWTQVTGLIKDQKMSIYVNGVLQNSVAYFSDPIGSASTPVYIGGQATPYTTNFMGRIDEVGLYNYALSQTEIASLVSQGGCIGVDKGFVILQNKEVLTTCALDEDCTLVNKYTDYKSCYPGVCEMLDYSLANYIAVNKNSFEEYKASESSLRPPAEQCGIAPSCPVSIGSTNADYSPKCIDSICKKPTTLQTSPALQTNTCPSNTLVSAACKCGIVDATVGQYCCNNMLSIVPCAPSPTPPPPCANGKLAPPQCMCGTNPIPMASGYCCNGIQSATLCTSTTTTATPPQCAINSLVPAGTSCMCATQPISSGYCCSTATGYQNLAVGC